jgi:CubicO group peptidase (beta-lactamase class C family)
MKQAGIATAGLLTARLSVNAAPDDKRFHDLKEAITAHADLLRIPALAAAVVENGETKFLYTQGFADPEKKVQVRRDHIFPVASLTKTFAAVNLALYEQQGKISMDDYVLDYPFLSLGLTADRLYSPNLKIKHVLSHTSEGDPGSNFMYNGNRYSFVYGVFEKMSGNTKHYEAFADEVTKNILKPLNMSSTLPGYPTDKAHPAIPRIVTTWFWDKEHQKFNPDTGLSGATTLFPANGMLTSIDDLIKYSIALDNNTVLTAESYKKLTTPFVTNSGWANPYGMGWSTQTIQGRQVHWHYGYGDSYAPLIIRIPQEKRSFILLTGSVAASEPFFLGFGNLLNSPFAGSFFKHVIYKQSGQFSITDLNAKPVKNSDELFSQAMMRYWLEQNYHSNQGEALQLIKHIAKNDPGRFQKLDNALIWMLANLNYPALAPQMESLVKVYAASGWFNPETHELIAGWYKQNNNWSAAKQWYHKLADSKGYGEQWGVKNACTILGKYYLQQGEKEKGRSYLWREALYAPADAANQIKLMNPQL